MCIHVCVYVCTYVGMVEHLEELLNSMNESTNRCRYSSLDVWPSLLIETIVLGQVDFNGNTEFVYVE